MLGRDRESRDCWVAMMMLMMMLMMMVMMQ
jgi:hypothetical protein